MGVEHEVGLVLACECYQKARQQGVFEYVGYIAGVELVAVGKHGADYSTDRATAPAVQSFNFFRGITMGLQRLHVAARYSEAAIFNGVVYLAGMVPECEAKDIRSQTADVLAQIDQRLGEAGSSKAHLLRVQIFLADIKDIVAMNEVWDAWVVPGTAPPRATVQAALSDPDYRLEIVATAVQIAMA